MTDEKVIMACSGVFFLFFSEDPAPVRTLPTLKLHQFHVGKNAGTRAGWGGATKIYCSTVGRLRLLLVILLEYGWNHHSPTSASDACISSTAWNQIPTRPAHPLQYGLQPTADHSFSQIQGSWDWSRPLSSPNNIFHRTLKEQFTLPPLYQLMNFS